MPSRMIHYVVATQLSRSLGIQSDLFLLGNLAPDAHDQSKEGNHKAHFRILDRDGTNEYLDIAAFEQKYLHINSGLFILGYLCHLIADNIWLKEMYERFANGITREEKNELSRICYRDYGLLNERLIHRYQLAPVELYPEGVIPPIDEIDSIRLQEISKAFLLDFTSHDKQDEPILLSQNVVSGIIDRMVSECMLKIRHCF